MIRKIPRAGRIAVAATLVALAAALLGVFTTSSSHPGSRIAFKKVDPDSSFQYKAGIANEGPDATYEAQQEAERAYPAASVPAVATQNAQSTFTSLRRHGHGPGGWVSVGPTQAKYPAVLDQFLAGGKDYIASGRVTALAIGGCRHGNKCSLYLGAAGGGVWAADRATDGNGDVHWQFKGGSLPSNAIGALLVDPSDPSGNTVYVGTGEPNASGDSEAGLGIYKSTDGGDSWTLVPGSDLFTDRAVGALAFDGSGNLLVGCRQRRSRRRLDRAARSAARRRTAVPFAASIARPARPSRCFARQLSRGVNEIGVDPNNSSTLYIASFQEGVWRSLDNGTTWTQIKSALDPALSTDRAQFALAKLTGGFTRMYLGVGNQNDRRRGPGPLLRHRRCSRRRTRSPTRRRRRTSATARRSAGTTTSSTHRPRTRTWSISAVPSTTTR